MITAALPGSGDWGTEGEALAAEQSAVADAPELQSLLVRGKGRGGAPCDAPLPATAELELVG